MGREKPNYVTNVVLQAPTTENDDRVPVSARRGYLNLPRAPLPLGSPPCRGHGGDHQLHRGPAGATARTALH